MKYSIPSQKLMSVFNTWMKINYPNYFGLEPIKKHGGVFNTYQVIFRDPKGFAIFIFYFYDHFNRENVLNLDNNFFNDVVSTFSNYGSELIKKWFKENYGYNVELFFHEPEE